MDKSRNKSSKPARFSLKDHLFNQDRVQYLASLFAASGHTFDIDGFTNAVMKRLSALELKQRIVHIAECLEDYLPQDFSLACQYIMAALPPPLDPTKRDDDFGDFIFAPLGEYVVRNGLAAKQVARSLRTLHAITQRFSMEDAIRYFIDAHPEKTLAALSKWKTDDNYHVRRLVSEGTRPRLPWSARLSIDVTRPIEFLDVLHADPTRYVTRSVANHLNDITKMHPQLVLDTLGRWKEQGRQSPTELQWLIRHALRTLVKQGDSNTLRFLGFSSRPAITVSNFELASASVRAGEALEFSFEITATKTEPLIVDYVIEFLKSNGVLSPKVHKIKQLEIAKGETCKVTKRHPFRANASTFTLYPGIHYLAIQINGQQFQRAAFELRN